MVILNNKEVMMTLVKSSDWVSVTQLLSSSLLKKIICFF